jgi:hypothetical protein
MTTIPTPRTNNYTFAIWILHWDLDAGNGVEATMPDRRLSPHVGAYGLQRPLTRCWERIVLV